MPKPHLLKISQGQRSEFWNGEIPWFLILVSSFTVWCQQHVSFKVVFCCICSIRNSSGIWGHFHLLNGSKSPLVIIHMDGLVRSVKQNHDCWVLSQGEMITPIQYWFSYKVLHILSLIRFLYIIQRIPQILYNFTLRIITLLLWQSSSRQCFPALPTFFGMLFLYTYILCYSAFAR